MRKFSVRWWVIDPQERCRRECLDWDPSGKRLDPWLTRYRGEYYASFLVSEEYPYWNRMALKFLQAAMADENPRYLTIGAWSPCVYLTE